ncbi:MAG: hypothetical protein PHE53_06635 [Thermoguttaceae bacterium]|nr:hypothetical protein [Thermoguttaceae bacterium]
MAHSSVHNTQKTTSAEPVSSASSTHEAETLPTPMHQPSKIWLILAVLLVLVWWTALLVMGVVLC